MNLSVIFRVRHKVGDEVISSSQLRVQLTNPCHNHPPGDEVGVEDEDNTHSPQHPQHTIKTYHQNHLLGDGDEVFSQEQLPQLSHKHLLLHLYRQIYQL